MMELPIARPRLLVFYCWLIVLVWAGLAFALVSLLLTVAIGFPFWAPYGYLPLLPFAVAVVTVAPLLRCPHCRRRVTIQTFSPVHPASLVNGKSPGWASVITSVIGSRRFVCIHCGDRVAVNRG
jgi:DNA-directed RNA polymerase subunit RPC12/RpoP